MKLTTIFLLAASLQLSARTYSQTVSISVKATPLAKVFSAIEKQTGYVFFYDGSLLREAKPVTIDLSRVDIESALKQIFSDQPLSYSIKEKTINVFKKSVVAPKPEVVSVHPLTELPLLIDVHGKVMDENGKPVEGVAVRVKGTNKGTTTNAIGEFSLTGVDDNSILSFSHVNLQAFEVKVAGKTEFTITLKAKISELGDVIIGSVNSGYQSITRERAVGSFSKVDSSLFHREVSTDMLSRLDGITNSLLFDNHIGSTSRLQIRGISTIQSDSRPLIILDNFPYTGDINNINPNDVIDVTLLKDAAAASIWGARAGNGVIVITTRQGKYNQPLLVSARSNIQVQQKPDLFYFPQMNTSDFIDVEQLLFARGFYTSNLSNTTTRPIISPVVEILNKQKNGLLIQADADAQINALRSIDVRNDYSKYVFRNAVNQQNYINFSGGNNMINYNLSTGYDHNLSKYQGPGYYARYNVNGLTSFKPAKGVEINAAILFNQSNSVVSSLPYPINPLGGKSQLYPYAKLADAQENHLSVPYKYRLSFIDTVGGGNLLDWHYKPLDELANQGNTTKTQYVQMRLGAKVNILSWVNAEMKYQYTSESYEANNNQGVNTFFTRDLINTYTNLNTTTATLRNPIPIGAILDRQTQNLITQSTRAQLNFIKSWSKVHEFSGLIAGEITEQKTNGYGDRYYGLDNNNLSFAPRIDFVNLYKTFVSGTNAQIPTNSNIGSNLNRIVSLLANVSYTYDRRYTFYASGRKDGSNLFGVDANNKWKPLWSVGGNWDISHEKFYHINFLSSLRLRTSYGYTGNVNNSVPAYAVLQYGQISSLTGTPTATLTSPPNPDLHWEQVGIFNVGLDFSAFKNRIRGNIDWFNKRASDVIANFPIDPTTGLVTANRNSANLSSRGFDIQLTSQNTRGAVSWTTSVNLSYAKTIVTNYFQNPVFGIPSTADINPAVGKIAWGLYAYKWAGLDPANGDPQGYYKKQISKSYNSIINDSFNNQVFIGSSLPLYFGNILNSFSYKGFTISANIIFKFDYYFRRPTISYTNLFNSWIGNADFSKRWQKPGDEATTNVPSMIYPANSSRDAFYANSEVNIEKGDNIRLQDIRLSYDYVPKISSKWPIKSLQLYLYANNLNFFLWRSSNSGLNPDYPTSSIPPFKSIAAGINLNF